MSPRSLALLLAVPLFEPAQDANEEEAKKLLLDAEVQAKRGRFALSSQRYRELAKRWPETEAGRIASERARPSAFLGWADVLRHGPSENRVDVVLLGDGYTLDHQDTFETLADDVPKAFEAQPEYAEYWQYFNFERAILVSKDDGVDEYGREYDTVLGGRRSGAIQGQVTVDHQKVMTMLDEVPGHDGLAVVFVKLGVLGTGGGGIACIGGGDTTTLIHEFGHAFADLGDEYSQNTGHRGRVGRSANVSDTGDPELVPWRHWIEARVPGVGAYEGANGQSKGAWKPTSRGCVMGSGGNFCPPCREATVLAIHEYVDPIDACSPEVPFPAADPLPLRETYEFEVTVMRPKTHALDVRWWVLDEASAPPPPRPPRPGALGGTRGRRCPLPEIAQEPVKTVLNKEIANHAFAVDAKKLGPGRHRVVCRVRDVAKPRGERWPWVLSDERGLLESERAWWILVEEAPTTPSGKKG